MDLIHAIALALIQGLTEFLPISSSAHLILPFQILGWPDQGLAFDTAVHLGSLLAVIWYFRDDLLLLIQDFGEFVVTGKSTENSRLAVNLIIATLPLIPVGFFFRDLIELWLRSVEVIIVTTIGFALLLLIADWRPRDERHERGMTWVDAVIVGLAQCLALIPGTSRSGVTMTAALLRGYSREASARISFLLSIPAIAGAATLKLVDLFHQDEAVDWLALCTGFAVAAITAYACIKVFLALIARIGFMPFIVYRLLLGTALIIWLTV
ncbi:MAG: undecaprenyl-diphosphate phosphatase [Pseudomonadales bacterium]